MKYKIFAKPGSGRIVSKIKRLAGKPSPKPQAIFSVGGDGTFLLAELAYPGLPKLNIGHGRLSFLSEVGEAGLENAIKKVKSGRYRLRKEIKLRSNILPDALNELVISSPSPARMIELDVFVDGEKIDEIRGDGVIVSTPTGSTAYSMSAGGPIILREANVFSISPLAPFKMASRPIVVPAKSRIEIIPKQPALAAVDGQKRCRVPKGKKIVLKLSPVRAKIISIRRSYHFDKIRQL